MIGDILINLNTAANAALHPLTAGTLCIEQLIWEPDLTDGLLCSTRHVYMWLLKTYAIPAGTYSNQVQRSLGHPILTKVKKWTIFYKNGC